MEIGSNFDGHLFGKSRERVTRELQFYHPKNREASWFFEENPNQSSTAGCLISQADHYYYKKNWLQAAQHYLKARELLTEKSSLYQRITLESLSRCNLHLGNYDTSMEWAQKLLDMCQSLELTVVAHSLISNICHGLGQSAEEAKHLKFCLSRQPLNGIHWFHLGLSYLSRREKCSPPVVTGDDDRPHHHHRKTNEKTDQETNLDGARVGEELGLLLSQSEISSHHEHGQTNGFENSEYVENGRKIGVSCKTDQNQYHSKEDSIGKSDGRDDRRKLNANELSNGEEGTGLTYENLQNVDKKKHRQSEMGETLEDVVVLGNGSSDEQGREERRLRVVTRNCNSDESTEMSTRECLHDAALHKGKGRAGSCHVCSARIEDDTFALICLIRARMLLKSTSTLCSIRSKKVFLEVESCIQSLDFTEAYVTEVHQLCWKRQFGLETRQGKSEDNEKKGRNNLDLISEHLESIFEDFWFRGILLQTNVGN